jgi:hypothetical protein
MAQNEYMDEKIDNYLTGKLSVSDRLAFEAEIASDPALRDEVELQKLLMGAIIQFRKQELKDYIKKNTVEASRNRSAGPMWMSIAAAFILAVGAGFYVFLKNQKAADSSGQMAVHQQPASKQNPSATIPQDTQKKELASNENKVPAGKKSGSTNPARGETDIDDHRPPQVLLSEPNEKETPELKKAGTDSHKIESDKQMYRNDAGSRTYQWNGSVNQGLISKDENFTLNVPERKNIFKSTRAKNKKGQMDTSDIRSDVLLMDTTINLGIADKAAPNTYGFLSNNDSTQKATAPRSLNIKFWNSSVNFKGYIFYKNVLSLYGVPVDSKIMVKELDGSYYMKLNGKVYPLNDENYYNDFPKPLANKKSLNQLGF